MSRAIERRNFAKEVRQVLRDLFAEHPNDDLTPSDIERLAMESGKLPADWIGMVRDAALGKELRQIARSWTFKNEHGDEVRMLQSYRTFAQTDEGEEVQQTFWRDIHTMNRRQMLLSYQGRKAHARDVDRKADIDLQYWNEVVAPKLGEQPIQLDLFRST